PPPHRGSHGVLGSAGGTDGFYFQPPFLAGLSGYVAELIPAMLTAFLESDRGFARSRTRS
ncbi:MAG: hypothetical protein DI606_19065, partial [Sphingobium sp.]